MNIKQPSCDRCAPHRDPLPDSVLEPAARALQALAHPVRLRIVETIARHGGDLCVCEVQSAFELSQPTISHHLRVLREAGLVSSHQRGTWVHYRVEPDSVERLLQALSALSALPEPA